ncbi:MAG: hypothetical protein ACK2T0_01515 [Anaerolineales bacterium]
MAFSLVRYSQQDPQWKDDLLGDGPETIGHIGSGLTCAAMYASGWGMTDTPGTLNRKLRGAGGFVKQAIVWAALGKLHSEIKPTGLTICRDTVAPVADIASSITAGQPVIVEVDFSPAEGLQTHWILLHGVRGDDFLMLDPWPFPVETAEATLMSRFGQGAALERAIKSVAWFRCSLAEPSRGVGAVETDLYVWPLASNPAGLRLHPQPSEDAQATYAEMPGVRLNVIEPKAAAIAKIGRKGQWLYIRDPSGHQGYVGAWYVEQVPDGAPAPTLIPPPASEPKRFQVLVLDNVGPLGIVARAAPSRESAKVNVEHAGALLTVTEAASTGLPKIGVEGEWLAIRTSNKHKGFVPGQYVQLKP